MRLKKREIALASFFLLCIGGLFFYVFSFYFVVPASPISSSVAVNPPSLKDNDPAIFRTLIKSYVVEKKARALETESAPEEKNTSESTSRVFPSLTERYQRANQNSDLKSGIRDFLGPDIDKVGVSFYDLSSGQAFNINGDKIFMAASTFKVLLNLVIADKVSSGEFNDTDMVSYMENDFERGTGILQNQDISIPLPVSMLCEYSIRYSDNIATNMLLRHIGYSSYIHHLNQLTGRQFDAYNNVISANNATAVLKVLYHGAKTNPRYTQVIEWMKDTVFHDRLDRDIHSSIVAHKVGNYGENVHDIGIIYTDRPYILSIYTNGVNSPNEVIALISDLVYEHQVTP